MTTERERILEEVSPKRRPRWLVNAERDDAQTQALVAEATDRAYAMQDDAPEVSALIARLANALSNYVDAPLVPAPHVSPPSDPTWQAKALDLLDNYYDQHRDPSSSAYNECEKPGEECLWCSMVDELRASRGSAPSDADGLDDLVYRVLKENEPHMTLPVVDWRLMAERIVTALRPALRSFGGSAPSEEAPINV